MPADLSNQRCFNHGLREAVAKCPGCGRFFCRECVTEHESRVLCVHCLSGAQAQKRAPLLRVRTLMRAGGFLLSVVLIWFLVYALGRGLLMLPDTFHEKTIWQSEATEQ